MDEEDGKIGAKDLGSSSVGERRRELASLCCSPSSGVGAGRMTTSLRVRDVQLTSLFGGFPIGRNEYTQCSALCENLAGYSFLFPITYTPSTAICHGVYPARLFFYYTLLE